jgi:hypothetical protein
MSACNVSNQNCTASPGVDGSKTRGICFACGLPVCMECSSRIKWYNFGKKRICDNCREDKDRESIRRKYRFIA